MKIKYLILIISIFTGVTVSSQTKKIKKEYYPNGNLKLETETLNGKPHGTIKLFYENKNLKDLTFYKTKITKNGDSIPVKDGLHKSYNEAGQIILEGKYKNNKQDGLWNGYNDEGKLISQKSFNKGIPSGVFITYYDSGNIKSKGEYKKGVKRNNWVDYYPNGTILKNYNFSRKGRLKNGKTLDINGIIKTTESYDGDFGRYQRKEYNEKGKITSLYESMNKSAINGKLTTYQKNGKIKSIGTWTIENKKDYLWKFYDEIGNLFIETQYDKDIMKNKKEYFLNGNLYSEHNFENGVLNGLTSYYYQDGKLFTTRDYLKGRLMNVIKLLNNSGEYLDIGTIKNGNGYINIYDNDGNFHHKVNVIDGIEQVE
jgi:antitoxin component YwqK of YwqJK toxin-antitoxin module